MYDTASKTITDVRYNTYSAGFAATAVATGAILGTGATTS